MKMQRSGQVDISVVIPTYGRPRRVTNTVGIIKGCDPSPAEIIVHVDGEDHETANMIRRRHPDVRILISKTNRGPGGGRNLLIKSATYEIVASFDDDSYPVDENYFARLKDTFTAFPNASVISSNVFTRDGSKPELSPKAFWVHTFTGCGCAYRRSDFLKIDGYLELTLAYGAEEQDVALQMHSCGFRMLQTDWLRVFHDTAYGHRQNVATRAAWISNVALLIALRYPLSLYSYGLLQIGNAMLFAIKQRRSTAIVHALVQFPRKLAKHWHRRTPLSAHRVLHYLRYRSEKVLAAWPAS